MSEVSEKEIKAKAIDEAWETALTYGLHSAEAVRGADPSDMSSPDARKNRRRAVSLAVQVKQTKTLLEIRDALYAVLASIS